MLPLSWPDMDIEAEIRDLKKRVDDLEGAFSVLTGQLRTVSPGLTDLGKETRDRFDRVESTLRGLDAQIGSVGTRMNGLELQVWSLRDDLPALIGAAVRSGLKRSDADP